jgi:hypothetical protein
MLLLVFLMLLLQLLILLLLPTLTLPRSLSQVSAVLPLVLLSLMLREV